MSSEHDAKPFVWRNPSAEHWIEFFREYYGPVHKAFAALGDAARHKELHDALLDLLRRFDRGGPDSLIVPADYLEVVIRRT